MQQGAQAANLAEKGRVGPLVERERLLRRVNANGALVVLVREAFDGNLRDLPLVGHESVLGDFRGAVGAVGAQDFNRLVDADDHGGVQEALEDAMATDVPLMSKELESAMASASIAFLKGIRMHLWRRRSLLFP
jgi:hypothetical protein